MTLPSSSVPSTFLSQEDIVSLPTPPTSQSAFPHPTPWGKSAAAFVASAKPFASSCAPLDGILEAGLPQGHILELSGPPGTAKDALARRFARTAVEADRGVLFVDMQNMSTAATLRAELDSVSERVHLVHHLSIFSLPELVAFLYNVPSFLDANPSIPLLILSSISFPFQTAADLSISSRTAVLQQIKQLLARLCAARNLTIVITSQMATKLLKPDGSPANFDTGSRAVLVPQLGHTYLPSGRTYRVVIVPQTRTTGLLRLISSPGHSGQALKEAQYEMVDGVLQPSQS
ncbi:hypothetical protein FA95DRAFT_1557149 [Auriscalpium vulgare]|uniref:Uncharacterized protein n=1 Tax=Auriscalpium vulgare TaxID=40419 RepID=A0ACB8RZ94_9AGAM|nr:hypothetical protein FA95DRAFT_1557149 [Auriscalpium vulgare]